MHPPTTHHLPSPMQTHRDCVPAAESRVTVNHSGTNGVPNKCYMLQQITVKLQIH